MHGATKLVPEPAGAIDEANLTLLRELEERRLQAALKVWESERKRLEEAIAWGEAKEREFREIQEDIKIRLAALDLVASMSRASKPEAATQPASAAATQAPAPAASAADAKVDTRVRRSWRPLFSASLQPAAAGLSILP